MQRNEGGKQDVWTYWEVGKKSDKITGKSFRKDVLLELEAQIKKRLNYFMFI